MSSPPRPPTRLAERGNKSVRVVILETLDIDRHTPSRATMSDGTRARTDQPSERARQGRGLFVWHAVVACVAFLAAAAHEDSHRSSA
jgi:hypothetical protein